LRLPYDDQSYVREEELYDFARANGLDVARMHYLIEQRLLVPQRKTPGGDLYNACSVADTMEFIDKMGEMGLSVDMQQVIVEELARFEEGLWKETVSSYRKAHPATQTGSLSDARLRVAASVSVINSIQRERRWILSGVTDDPAREKQLKHYFSLVASRKRRRAERARSLEQFFGRD
ncbi:MAG: hypothetical protein ACM3WT_09145, partial [Bacillota bacterium]